MAREVFNLRSRDSYLATITVAVMGLLCIIMGPVYWKAGEGSKFSLVLTEAGGLFCLVYGVFTATLVHNHRIEIEDDQISLFNWIGKKTVQGSLQSVEGLSETAVGSKLEFNTDGGLFRVRKQVSRYQTLKAILEAKTLQPATQASAPQDSGSG